VSRERVAIIGAGGHAVVVASTLIAAGCKPFGFFDDDESKWGRLILGVPVLGPISDTRLVECSGAIIGIGANRIRRQIAENLKLKWVTAIHPFSYVDPDAEIGPGTVVFAGCIIQPGARVGAHVIVNTKASIDHHCIVGDYAHVAVAHLGGGAAVEEGAFIALHSVILPGVQVGAWATVGAGAVVTRDVDPAITVVGIPASPLPEPVDFSLGRK